MTDVLLTTDITHPLIIHPQEVVKISTEATQEVKITSSWGENHLVVMEQPQSVKVKVAGVIASTGTDPLSGLNNLTTLYEVAKL